MASKKKSRYSRRQYSRRAKKVSFIKNLPRDIERLDSSISRKDFPVGQLAKAKCLFVYGFFEECILNSAFAVEYGLLIKFDEELEVTKKQSTARKKGGLAFREAIDIAKGGWIDYSLAEDLLVLNNLRNMAAHPGNWLSLYSQLINYYENPAKVKKWIYKVTNQQPQQIEKNFANKFDKTKGEETVRALKSVISTKFCDLPDVSWAARKDTLQFQFDKIQELVKPIANDLINKKTVIGLTKRPESASKYLLSTYKFHEILALKSLEIAHNALCQLGFIESTKQIS
jgi:hypothetical protein